MKKPTAIALVALPLAALLPGCALLGLGPRHAEIAAQSTLPMGSDAFVRFEQGRAALDAGLNAEAIAAFSEARVEPELLGPSLNGMAVAWSRLGRLDLAERYFTQAVAAAPQDVRFAANLAQLQQTLQAMALRYDEPALAEAAVATPPASLAGAGTLRSSNGIVRLVTQGAGSVHVATAPVGNRLVRIDPAQVQLSSAVTEPPRNGARVRIRFGSGESTAGQAGIAVASAGGAQAGYPIRVAIRQ